MGPQFKVNFLTFLQAFCNSLGGYLVQLETPEENENMQNYTRVLHASQSKNIQIYNRVLHASQSKKSNKHNYTRVLHGSQKLEHTELH